MRCPICGMDNQLPPVEFYSKTCSSYGGNEGCIQSRPKLLQEFIKGRREYILSIRPNNPVPIALSLAKEFREKNTWCQKGNNEGQCLTASDELTRVLDMEAISSCVQFGSMKGQTHSWVEFFSPKDNESFILDITADQFEFCKEEIICIPASKGSEYGYRYE